MMLQNALPPCSYSGSSSIPIVFAEIVPVVMAAAAAAAAAEEDGDCDDDWTTAAPPNRQRRQQQLLFPLTNAGAKKFLLRETRAAEKISMKARSIDFDNDRQLFIRWNETNGGNDPTTLASGCVFQNNNNNSNTSEIRDPVAHTKSFGDREDFPLIYIPSDNPMIIDRQPCCVIAYAYHHPTDGASHEGSMVDQKHSSMCHFTQDTLIRILPPKLTTNSSAVENNLSESLSPLPTAQFQHESMLCDLIGEEGSSNMITDDMAEEVLQNHNEETIRELKFKMSNAMMDIDIGTTRNAFRIRETQKREMRKIEQSIRAFCRPASEVATTAFPGDGRNETDQRYRPSLIVHSPCHGDGKTLLVRVLARQLGCSAIHMVRPGALLARYGSRTDAALESQLHAMLVSAACRKEKACIVLDQLDAMLPARLSGRTMSGDAGLPVFGAIASYLRMVAESMLRKREFPFPTKNGLYNPPTSGGGGCSGQVVRVTVCLVGIVTCPDGGWRSAQTRSSDGGILDCLIGDRYRMPLLTAETIVSAFDAAFAREGVSLEPPARQRLSLIARSAQWAKGSVFVRVAKQLRWVLSSDGGPRNGTNSGSATIRKATVRDLISALATVNSDVAKSLQAEMRISAESSSDETTRTTPFGSIGGNERAKVALEEALALDDDKREMLSRFGLSPPTGVLLYGPPGCGKTLLAKAVAKLFRNSASSATSSLAQGGTFISMSISDIVSSEVGTSEKTIAASFEFAEKNAPSVIFLDEFQALFTDRNRGGSGKLTTTLLQCLDDIKRWYDIDRKHGGEKRIVVIAATNTPWMVDSAFLRPGRFDRVVHVGLPSPSERKSILRVHIEKMKVRDGDNTDRIDQLCEELSNLTEGFSGVDIAALCRAAAVRALGQGEGLPVEEIHFKDALNVDVFPSSDEILVQKLKTWRP